MKTIFIRMRTLLAFGVILLVLSFAWIGVAGLDFYQEAIERVNQATGTDKEGKALPDIAPILNEPTVAIVPQDNGDIKDSFFNEYKMERDRKRSEQVEILREIVNNPNSSAPMRLEAQQKLIRISDSLEKDSKVENALIAKGFKEAVVVIQQGAVMVFVPSKGLRQDEVARISDIVMKITGCKLEEVVIVPKAI